MKKKSEKMTKGQTTPTVAKPTLKPMRRIPAQVTLRLYVRAGGRCEFDGCNAYLMEHHTTNEPGNFAEQGHIVAFNEGGARGQSPSRPNNINNISNLMLLCPKCHHLVDDVEPEKYTVDVLRQFKQSHEDRVFHLTDIAKGRDTVPLVMTAQIAGRTLEISDDEMQRASAPNWIRRDKIKIDLSHLPDTADPAYFRMGASAIDAKVEALGRLPPGKSGALRVSVFALAPIPLLVHLGSRLSDKWTVDLYQRRRTGENPWTWEPGEGIARFVQRRLATGHAGVALLVNVSGRNSVEVFGESAKDWSVYEISVDGETPSPVAVRTTGDLDRFKTAYLQGLAQIRSAHPEATEIHLLAAVPSPVAVVLGMLRLPKVDPKLVVYDRDQRTAELKPMLSI